MDREMIVPEGQSWAPEQFGMAPALRVGETVYLSGVVVIPADDSEAALEKGIENTFEMIGATLAAAGGGWDHAVDITSFHVGLQTQKAVFMRVKNRYVKGPHFPAWTAIDVSGLWEPNMVLEIKVAAHIPAA